MYNRPDDITEYEISEWEKQFDAIPQVQLSAVHSAFAGIMQKFDPNWKESDPKERFLSGQWLERELHKLLAPENDVDEVCQAVGQMHVHYADPWDASREMLANYQKGEWDRPGEELAIKLLEKFTGLKPPPPEGKILEDFHQLNTSSLEPDETNQNGIRMPNCFIVNSKGELVLATLAMFGKSASEDTYKAIYSFLRKDQPIELVFGLDRWAKPEQGTTRANVFSVTYFNRGKWKFGIIEYDLWPKVVVDPIRWDCEFWNNALRREFESFFKGNFNFDMDPYPPRAPVPITHEHFKETSRLLNGGKKFQAEAYLEREGYTQERAARIIKALSGDVADIDKTINGD